MTTSRRPWYWSWRALWILLAVAFLGVRPVWAQSAAAAAAEDLLQSIIARITVRTSLGTVLCHGFVAEVRGKTAYIVTAKHCLKDLSPMTVQRQEIVPDLAITITYANGGTGTGTARGIYWHTAQDDLVIAASFDRLPTSYTGRCPSCITYRTLAPTVQPIPVLSVLSSAGGLPVLSTGMVLVTESGEWIVLLPTAPGTSGAPVIDLQGNLVGVVSSATVIRGTEAGVVVELVPGGLASDLVHYAIGQIESAATVPSPPTLPPSPPGPPPSIDVTGYVLEVQVSGDQAVYTVTLDSGGHIYLISTRPCHGINVSDSVTLHVTSGYVRLTTANASCVMLVTVHGPTVKEMSP
jgi:hypothetical protein